MGTGIVLGKILFLLLVTQALSDGLPSYAVPSSYSLDLILDPRATTYDGIVEITFSQTDLTVSTIQLHASSETIDIQTVLLNYNDSCEVKSRDSDTDIVTLECPTGSLADENTLVINFEGTYSVEDMSGLYKSTYEEDGEEIVLLATQFEPANARRAFPCFDEPSLKATFDIFITHPNDYAVLSNMPGTKTFTVSSDNTQEKFDTTPPISTYLIAFIVSKFVSNSDGKSRDYDDQVFSRPSAKNYTTIAATYAPTLIDLLGEWTGLAYADLGNTQAYQIAIPDFAAGAMENWGLITFREVDLLDEKDTTSNAAKQRIITSIAHELTHQWFGDYVTLDWWSDTWLNEGFATYFEYYIPDQLEDNLDTMNQFIVNEFQPVLLVDSVPSALPLTSDASSAAEISNKFDDISYSKGASVIWMLRNILGEKTFKEGLHSYLTTYKYGNTNPSYLLDSFTAPSSVKLSKYMENWIYKSGFPLVSAKLNGSTVVLTQERFTLQSSNDTEATEWYIPISYTNSAEKKFDINIVDWLKPNSTIEIELDEDSWIVLNIKQSGYYRVNYEDTLWHRIIMALEEDVEVIDVLNRAQMVDDIFNIARAGGISYDMVFHFAGYLKSETGYYPWVSALNALSYISGKLNDNEAEKLLQAKILSWINKAFPSDAEPGTGHVDKLKDVLILDWACRLGQDECISYVDEAYQNYKNSSKIDDYNKRGLVFCHGFRNSENPKEDYDYLISHFKQSSSVVEQNEIISALGCTEDSEVLDAYLSETISSNSSIRKQDGILVYRAVYSHGVVGVNASLNFLEDNLDSIATRFAGMSVLPNLILGLANRVFSDEQIDGLTKVITDNTDKEGIQLVAQRAIEIMTANKNWRDAYAADIKKILKEDDNAANAPEPTILFLIVTFSLFYIFSDRK